MRISASCCSAPARWIYASLYLAGVGRFEESIAEMARAADQDPLNPTWHAVWALHMLRLRPEEAMEIAHRSVAIDSTYFLSHVAVGEAAWKIGRRDEAVAAWERSHALAPWFTVSTGSLGDAPFRGARVTEDSVPTRAADDDHSAALSGACAG